MRVHNYLLLKEIIKRRRRLLRRLGSAAKVVAFVATTWGQGAKHGMEEVVK